MITGDNPLTACHVAKELKLTKKQTLVLSASGASSGGTPAMKSSFDSFTILLYHR